MMIADLRGGFLLAAVLIFLLFTLAILSLSTILRPGRWCERVRPVG
jgi:hypothetical protein